MLELCSSGLRLQSGWNIQGRLVHVWHASVTNLSPKMNLYSDTCKTVINKNTKECLTCNPPSTSGANK